MKFIKPHKDVYILVLGSGRVITLDETALKAMSMAYDEIRFVSEGHRRAFSLTDTPIETLFKRMKENRKCRDDC